MVGDLARAMERLRGERPGATGAGADPAPRTPAGPPPGARPRAVAPGEPAPAPVPAVAAEAILPPPPPPRPPVTDAPVLPPSLDLPTQPWLSAGLATLAGVDEAAAERLLLAALAVQAASVARDVTYELELPITGRHRVAVARGDRVTVTPIGDDHPVGPAEFRLRGGAGALAPLAGGGAPHRLSGVRVRGHRLRLRRLLRALGAPVGLPELWASRAPVRPDDLLALLCGEVKAKAVRGADFCVAYVVTTADDVTTRVLIRAAPDGRLGVDDAAGPEAVARAAATVTADADELVAVLAGQSPARIDGDAQAVARLHRWLLGAQRLPA